MAAPRKGRATDAPLQLDLFAPPPPPLPVVFRDVTGEALAAAGLAPNDFILGLNGGLNVPWDVEMPAPWNLPSRLFQFPIEVGDPTPAGRAIGLVHPLLVDHPFVLDAERRMGMTFARDGAPNRAGYSKARTGLWWHSVDLANEAHWRALWETRRFTTDGDMLRAIEFAIGSPRYRGNKLVRGEGSLSIASAREFLGLLGAPEPADRSRRYFTAGDLSGPSVIEERNGKGAVTRRSWPINLHPRRGTAADAAWLVIHAVEDKLFTRGSGGHLGWSDAGRAAYAAGGGEPDDADPTLDEED